MNRPLRNENALVRVATPISQNLYGDRSRTTSHGVHGNAPRAIVMRKYFVSSLQDDGSVKDSHHIAPATVDFESAFSAFARGTLIQTDSGAIAIEDLLPGDRIMTAEHGYSPLLWVGSMTMLPNSQDATQDPNRNSNKLTRITADTFGISRPMPDFLAGPNARLLHRPLALRDLSDQGPILTPMCEFVDGINVIDITPQSAVTVFHLTLAQHATVFAAGLQVETYHPGRSFGRNMGQNTMALFLSLFPHINELADFGPLAHPRATLETLDKLTAA